MATISTSELTNILEKVIDPTLRHLHIASNKSPTVRMWKEGRNGGEGTTRAANNTFYVTTRYGRHSNMQGQAESATLIRGRGRDSQPNFTTKTMAGAFTFTLKAKKSSEQRAGALVDTVMEEVNGMLERAKTIMAFYANNDATGVIGLVNDASPNSKSTIAVDNVRATAIDFLLDPGDSLFLGDEADRVAGTGVAVTAASVDSLTQITVDETIAGAANNDLIYFSEAYDVAGTANTGKNGLDGLLATSGTVQGITMATSLYYHAHVNTTAETVTTTRVLEYLQLADARVKDSSAFIITLGDLWWKLTDIMRGTTEIDADKVNKLLQGGAEGLRFEWFGGGTPVFYDPFARPGYVNGLDLNSLGYKQEWALGLVDDARGMAHRISQKLEFEVAASEDGEFYVIDPRSCFKLTGKTTT